MGSKSLFKKVKATPAHTRAKMPERCQRQYEEKIHLWEKLKNEGLDDAARVQICNTSRATFYRCKKRNGKATPPPANQRNSLQNQIHTGG